MSGRTLSWRAPLTFSDGAVLDPSRDLSTYEIYVNDTGLYSLSDVPQATIPAVDPDTGNLVTSFELSEIDPPLQTERIYYLTMRAVDKNGVPSGFSLPSLRFIYR